MDLLQLRYFYECANYMSISKTAEKYHVPPSSVSASIRRLEKELGAKLFDRTPNRILLNSKGKIVHNSLKNIFNELDTMLSAVADGVDDTKEIKILAKAVRSLITEQIIAYKTKFAGTRFKLVADYNEPGIADFDIIIDTESDAYASYNAVRLGTQRIFLYVPSQSPLCDRSFRLEELSQMPFVSMCQERNHGKIFKNACKTSGFTPNVLAEVNDSACFRKMVFSGIGIGVSGELASSTDGTMALVPLEVSNFKYDQAIFMYYKTENKYGNTERFISFLQENLNKESFSVLNQK